MRRLFRHIRIPAAAVPCLLSSVDWISCRISTKLQQRNDVEVFTFLPTVDVRKEIAEQWGNAAQYLDIVKVRAFARRHEDVYWLQLLPIVTLAPIRRCTLDTFFHDILERFNRQSEIDLSNLERYANTPSAQQRVVQYCLSAALGHRFMRNVRDSVPWSIERSFDDREADAHFGPWLHDELAAIGHHAFSALWRPRATRRKSIPQPPPLPDSATRFARDMLSAPDSIGNGSANRVRNVVSDFNEIFLRLYDRVEIPARAETKRLGVRALSATQHAAPMGWTPFSDGFRPRIS
jgi:hypothetical protein